ncbi:conserved hypothetical protein [Ancylobacter novellus DSM 506]|uniref:Uncharacterized protein n=1 Tax=Ancylobacter novellus (strain ATCC 8093 / DSM 506 / JCM 20403 / CCM 1077 / IAM 12100 / NBRC 12443 / NCIMB 10456) TaxID=639283 RepID=D7A8T1_ANCN5|nr:invasion associated locus B family protein [Ancylobacter novellus]ADH90615.1 conserved hypothetical protein [Ancylobacter novellus DSM 506]
MIARTALAFGLLAFAAADAMAAQVAEMGQFKDWSAYTYKVDGKSECYAISWPSAKWPANLNHGDVSFFVTATERSPSRTEVSFQTGYEFAQGSKVIASIGEDTFTMFTDGKGAWLRRTEREPAFLEALRSGSEMAISATSARGNDTSYVFSLDGVTAATRRILSRCP